MTGAVNFSWTAALLHSANNVGAFMRRRLEKVRPVFVIGSYRSGTSALTWALGQHPNLFPLEETHFLYKLAVDVDNLYELSTAPGESSFTGLARYTARDFRGYFADACHRMVEDARRRIIRHSEEIGFKDPSRLNNNVKLHRGWWQPKRRWVDGTPENAHFVLPLLRLFPKARFIHIIRNPRRVATSLMHFSTVGSYDYAEEAAYRAWTRLVRASALAEQALGPGRVMQLAHDDLLANPQDALRRCLTFAGEAYHKDCLLPLREKINSSRYTAAGECSLEGNLSSEQPWTREAFELYARLLDGKGVVDGGPSAARCALKRDLREYRVSLKPDTNENLTRENAALRSRINLLEQEHRQLKRRLGHTAHSLEMLDWGPREILADVPFNLQPDGTSALWILTRNAPPDTTVTLNGLPLTSDVDPSGSLVTATVPRQLTAQPGELTMYLYSPSCGETASPITVKIEARSSAPRRAGAVVPG